MKPFLTFLLVLFLYITTFAQSNQIDTNDPRLQGLDEELTALLDTFKVAGFGVAIVEKDKVLYSKGIGYRDYEKKIPATANTLFAIGSCSKSFTSALLGQLKDEVKLEDSPIDYLPDLRFFNDELNNQVTIRDMMCHRTGLPRHDFAWYLFPSDSKEELMKKIAYQEPTAGIREVWQYNNFMFMLQGMIAEKVTGKSWSEAVRANIMNPLGMDRSNFTIDELEATEDKSFGYGLDKDKNIEKMDYYRIRAMGPAGSINSSANEMANWVITWIKGGKFGEEEILPEAYVREATSSHMIINPGLPGEKHPDLHFANYGYGWFLSSYRGHYRVQHGGNIDGFSANTCFLPSDSIGVVVLVNQNGSALPSAARNLIIDRMLELEKSNWASELNPHKPKEKEEEKKDEEKEEKTEPKPSAHALADFEGSFEHPGYGTVTITIQNDSVFAETPLEKYWLRHVNYDIFEPVSLEEIAKGNEGVLPIKFNFQTDLNGEVSAIHAPIQGGLDPIAFKRKVVAKEVDAADLEKYVGEYQISTVTAKTYIKEGALYVLVPGQPEYELIPTKEHRFAFKDVEGFSVLFEVDDNGAVKSLSFVQPNGTFKAERKE